MTMETIEDLTEVDGHGIIVMDKLREKYPEKFNESGQMDYKWFETEIRPNYNVYVRHDVNSITFNMMTKPVSEGGKGCQLTAMVKMALHMLKKLNGYYPCRENSLSITKLEEALMWQEARTKDRVKRGVEGKNQI